MAAYVGATSLFGARFGGSPAVADKRRISSADSWEAKRPRMDGYNAGGYCGVARKTDWDPSLFL